MRELFEEIRYVETRISCFLALVWSNHQNRKTNKVGAVDKFMHRDYIVTLALKAPMAIHLGNIVLFCISMLLGTPPAVQEVIFQGRQQDFFPLGNETLSMVDNH